MAGIGDALGKMSPLGVAQAGVGLIQAGIGIAGLSKKKQAADKALSQIETQTEDPTIAGMYKQAQLDAQTGLGGSAKQLAKQGADEAMQAGLSSATDRKGGLAVVGAAVKGKQKAALGLAAQDEAARQSKTRAATSLGLQKAANRTQAFKSRQEKQILGYQKSLAELSATRQSISQGMSAVGGAAANEAIKGMYA